MSIKVQVKRLTFLMAEPFPYEGLSTRKLVLETAYYNVLTAYSREELFDTVARFPEIDAVIVHGELPAFDEETDIPAVKRKLRNQPVFVLAASDHILYKDADIVVKSHDPQALLQSIRDQFTEKPVQQGRSRS